ncbi:High mobility group protein B3 [Colletotrichum viniferum]|nr:High mobility group protein B3 [Colletotrichum viniferum]
MAQDLESIFQELGISQYLDIFLEQGFDTWDTILDITESDLDALGVKLGHRRKLQRRIANSRGHAPDVSLVSPARASMEEHKAETQRPDQPRPETKEGPVQAKRKYRRHPKPDENAPERPPSAYVLFSNKMRDELKGRNLTFTEIAKLVGEHWQNLTPAEKEPYETSALKAKEKYNHDLAEYKKTPEFRKYTAYLADFKARQASANQGEISCPTPTPMHY